MADDDADDRLLTQEALLESRLPTTMHFVEDGEELLDYLYRRRLYAPPNVPPLPSLILLDLNMPKVDGREALKTIKTDPNLRHIPIVVLTTSTAKDDVLHAYTTGASSFISKPVTFEGLVDVMRTLGKYWFETVKLPQL